MVEPKILVVDNDPEQCSVLKLKLEELGYSVSIASSIQKALEMDFDQYSLLLHDVELNDLSDFKVISYLKSMANMDVPVIYLSSVSFDQTLLDELKIGGCDYVQKPCSINEIAARVNSVMSCYSKSQMVDNDTIPNIYINIKSKQVLVDKIDIGLSRTEFAIFNLLYHISGKVISRDEIMLRLWPNQPYDSARKVDVSITRIRKKMGRMGKCIATRPGFGYYYDKKVAFNQ